MPGPVGWFGGFLILENYLPSAVVSCRLNDASRHRKGPQRGKRKKKKERKKETKKRILEARLGLAEAWSEFRIKIDQNGFGKNRKIWAF